jgi:hypothetical protein
MRAKKARRRYMGLALLAAIGIAVGAFLMAQQHNPGMFRKNVSKTETLVNAKAKLDMAVVYPWFPAMKADGTPLELEYLDEDGVLMRTETKAKPVVMTYTEEVYLEDGVTPSGAHDVYAAVSMDDGQSWKRKNISRMADLSSITVIRADGTEFEYPGHCTKPVMTVRGNRIFVAWSSKYAKSGRPRYAIKLPADGDDYPYDDPYWVDDIWGVGGQQQKVDYLRQYDMPGIGELPFSAVWCVRGVIADEDDVASGVGEYVGDIVWFKPERLTSGRRDALQLMCAGADGAGFGLVWQEDPEGLNPGKGAGPGEGWSGAKTNKTTDIWYSYIMDQDYLKVDWNFVPNGEREYGNKLQDPDFMGRPKWLVPMTLPVRISDNEIINTRNTVFFYADGTMIPDTGTNLKDTDGDGIPDTGIHRYFCKVPGLWSYVNTGNPISGTGFYDYFSSQGAPRRAAVTKDLRLMNGKTAASRPNLNFQTFQKPDGTKSAYALIYYEETHGNGLGAPSWGGEGHDDPDEPQDLVDGEGCDDWDEEEDPWDENGGPGPNDRSLKDEGKNVIFHTFEFNNPTVVSAGTIINLPEGLNTDGTGTPIYVLDADGSVRTDWRGQPRVAYENARRPRLIPQSKGNAQSSQSKTLMVCLYKEGEEGKGRPSDIMMRRWQLSSLPGNPYSAANLVPGFQNVSTVMPTKLAPPGNEDPQGGGNNPNDRAKVLEWVQTPETLKTRSAVNPYEDARAHRGVLRGDFLFIGYTYTPNWRASRNYNDKYNFYIRRSFNGGKNWTTDPASNKDVEHTEIFLDPDAEDSQDRHFEVVSVYPPGAFEPARNVSLMRNNFESVIEPRLVAPYGTVTGSPRDEDSQNASVVYFAYGTETNDEFQRPVDLFWSFTADKGQTLLWSTWVSEQTGIEHTRFPWLAYGGKNSPRGDEEDGEVQLREVPSGERMYAGWLCESPDEGSDIWMRRLMPKYFLPAVKIVSPGPNGAVKGTPAFTAEATDDRPLAGVEFFLREVLVQEGVETSEDIGHNGLQATLGEDGLFRHQFDTTVVPDDYYVLTAKATDANGNVRWSDPVRFSIKNWNVKEMYPGVRRFQAGRTIPIKFALRMDAVVDPGESFVYRQDLAIKAYKLTLYAAPQPLQTFLFGPGVVNYRVAPEGQLYIANYDTGKVPGQYMFEVRRVRNDFLLGSFVIETDRNVN